MKLIPYGKQFISKEDIKAVSRALKKNLITSGSEVHKFEEFFSKKVGSKFSVSCSNATSGLLLSYMALNIKQNDVLLMPSINFVASVNMASILGAKIFLTDTDPLTGHMRSEDIIFCIKKNKLKKIKLIVVMHNAGLPANMKEIQNLQKKYKFKIIEDACHALGAKYDLKSPDKVGNCKYSDLSVFSFHPVKNITTGEGGMITTNSKNLYKKLKILRNHGIIRKENKFNEYNWSYKVVAPGFNFRLNDFQCALGISQLKKLNKFVETRQKIAKKYFELFQPIKNIVSFPSLNNCKLSAFHLFIINFNINKIKINKNTIIKKLFNAGIATQVHYIPIFNFPIYKKLFKKNFFKNAIKYYQSSISIPIFYELKQKQINFVYNQIKKIVIKYSK